jgi:hypothetical protein
MIWAGHVTRMRTKRNAYRIMVVKSEGKRPLGRLKHRWKDNVKTNFREIGWGGVDWVQLTGDTDQWRALGNFMSS